MKLHGQIALVTGAAHRVGKAIALSLAREGADIVVHYSASAAAADDTAREIHVLGRRALVTQADLASWDAAQALGRRALDFFGGVDILINSASSYVAADFFGATEHDFDLAFDVNVKGTFALTQVVAKAMRERFDSSDKARTFNVVNILDESSFRPNYRSHFAHGASKAGLLGLHNHLVGALGPFARVNAVCPGPVLKPPDMSDEAWDNLRKTNPLRTLGTAEQVAKAVLALVAGPEFLNGTCVMLDGGRVTSVWRA